MDLYQVHILILWEIPKDGPLSGTHGKYNGRYLKMDLYQVHMVNIMGDT